MSQPTKSSPSGARSREQHRQLGLVAPTHLEHLSWFNVNDPPHLVRKTGIICTLGPSSRSVDMIGKLIQTGMTIARLNFSHGTHDYHRETLSNVRAAVETLKSSRVVGIALDTKGPEIRTGLLAGGDKAEIELKRGEKIQLTTADDFKAKSTATNLYVDYKNITKVVKPGSKVFVDDGLIALVVDQIDEGKGVVSCTIVNGGMLGSKKGLNLPGTNVDLPAVSQKDKEDLRFGVEQKVDMIFASFVRDAEGVREIRKVLGEDGKEIKIIAKIENQQGLDNMDEIIAESDGLMVARGDMGIEIPPEKVFVAQKMIIAKCNVAGKPAVCATQMLESMTHKPRPTRAEAGDVANAVLDGADCVMLSGETAKGACPLETVEMMHKCCREAEAAVYQTKYFEEILRLTSKPTDPSTTIAIAAVSAAVSCQSAAIIVITTTGRTAALISHFRPPCPIVVVTGNAQLARQLHLYRGIHPIHRQETSQADWSTDVENRTNDGISQCKERKWVKAGDPIVVVAGSKPGTHCSFTVRIIQTPSD